jgi:hypothetical protein
MVVKPDGTNFARHEQASAYIPATPERLFKHLDDQARLGAHMSRPSLMMGGGHMRYVLDEGRGQVVGSHIRMDGRAFGVNLSLDEVVVERMPPRRKVWRTMGEPTLIVIGSYEMGFELTQTKGGANLVVWIDYDLPSLATFYARWCVRQMVRDAAEGTAAK